VLFNSFAFFVFLAVVYAVYLPLSRRAQNRWLLAASYFFYGAWDWRFLGLIFASTVIDYAVGLALARSEDPRRRKQLVTASVVANLGLLGAFKYANFFMESLTGLLALFGLELSPFAANVVLPVGISFYTFQTLSYTIDIYRGRLRPTHDFLDFALFVAFFPQLVAGPIERAVSLLPQIEKTRSVSWEKLRSGSWLILWGLFKKVVIADNLFRLVDGVYAPGTHPTGPEVLVASYACSIMFFCDFSGYTDIARGTARLLGFELMVNFNLPFFTENLREFWQRWHISLSTWLRDYLYIPLGGNRAHVNRNLFLTMFLCGIWHGAGMNYVVFGIYHGVFVVLDRLTAERRERIRFSQPAGQLLWRVTCMVITFHFVSISFAFLQPGSIERTWQLMGALFTDPRPGLVFEWLTPFALLCAPMFLMNAIQLRTGELEPMYRFSLPVRGLVYATLIWLIVLFGVDLGYDFIYFQF
jgi:D-alanyl-lipoteichoic acid acyltransferase DltB (MBOAT superfamily)